MSNGVYYLMMLRFDGTLKLYLAPHGAFLDAANKSRHVGSGGIDGHHIFKSGYETGGGDTPKMIQIWKEIKIIGCLKVLKS